MGTRDGDSPFRRFAQPFLHRPICVRLRHPYLEDGSSRRAFNRDDPVMGLNNLTDDGQPKPSSIALPASDKRLEKPNLDLGRNASRYPQPRTAIARFFQPLSP